MADLYSLADGSARPPTAPEVQRHESLEGISEWLHRCGEHSGIVHATTRDGAAVDADSGLALCNRGRWWPLRNSGYCGPGPWPVVDDG
jgi:hypothetical protein